MRNEIFRALDESGVALGTSVQMNSPEICELISAAGLNFLFIDMQHGPLGIDAVINLIRATQAGGKTAPIVRLPNASPEFVERLLDSGAQGILAPGIERAQDIRAIVEAAHYHPQGSRGACPFVRANHHGVQPWSEYAQWTRDNIFICGIVESELGLRNYDEIIAEEGLSAVAIGAFDLSVSMGYPGNYEHPAVVAKLSELFHRARQSGLSVMGGVMDYNQLDFELERLDAAGVSIVVYPGDRFLLSAVFKSAMTTFKAGRSRTS